MSDGPSFEITAASYLEHGGEGRYLPPIIAYFGPKPIASVVPFDVKQMALELYPVETHSNSSRNRCALTPARAVIIHGYERGWCNLMRLTRFKEDTPKRKSPASPTWLHIFTRQCDNDGLPHVAALVLFMAQTGARVSEATALRWAQVDLAGRRALLLKTKTSVNSMRHLTDELVNRMRLLADGADPEAHVFRYISRYSVNERIKAVCDRAGLTYKSSHACGRHSFATNAIDMGMDVKTAMDAGCWKTASIFLEIYVHTRNAGRLVADRFNSMEFGTEL